MFDAAEMPCRVGDRLHEPGLSGMLVLEETAHGQNREEAKQMAQNMKDKFVKVLSLGAGVNSTALLVLKAQGKVDFDLAIFADTGSEQPETYEYLAKVIGPFCAKHNIELVRVQAEGDLLYEKYWKTRIIPTRVRGSCRDNFKIRVIRRYLLQNYANAKIETIIGFCKGEEKRKLASECQASTPLIDMGINREACVQIIKDAKLPIPIKSGCYFCPHQPQKSWISLLKNHPELYCKAEQLEKNGRGYPKFFLPYEYSLDLLRRSVSGMARNEQSQKQDSMCTHLPQCPFCEVENNEGIQT